MTDNSTNKFKLSRRKLLTGAAAAGAGAAMFSGGSPYSFVKGAYACLLYTSPSPRDRG